MKQREYWAQYDGVKKGQSLEEVQASISKGNLSTDGYDRAGLQLVHIAGKYLLFIFGWHFFHFLERVRF